jgi:hypothetical protein
LYLLIIPINYKLVPFHHSYQLKTCTFSSFLSITNLYLFIIHYKPNQTYTFFISYLYLFIIHYLSYQFLFIIHYLSYQLQTYTFSSYIISPINYKHIPFLYPINYKHIPFLSLVHYKPNQTYTFFISYQLHYKHIPFLSLVHYKPNQTYTFFISYQLHYKHIPFVSLVHYKPNQTKPHIFIHLFLLPEGLEPTVSAL